MEGLFKPKNPQKYRGDVKKIIYRSSYEFKLMMELDSDPNVLEYSSEEFFIPYRDPTNNNMRRYFPDFWVKKIIDGVVKETVIEVKPSHQVKPPKPPKDKRSLNSYKKQVYTYLINQAKWESARDYCARKNMNFEILTENELGIVRGTKK